MDPPLPPGARVTVVVRRGTGELVVVGHLDSLHPDLDLIDRLARLQWAAARLGIALGYADPCPTLRGVIELTGMDDVLLGPSVEAGREAEGLEVLGPDEVGPGGDPAV